MRNILLLVLVLLPLTTWAAEGNEQLNHENVVWSHLSYEASAFFVSLESDISLQSINKETAMAELVMKEESNLLFPSGNTVYRLNTFAEGFGKETRYLLWMDQNGEVLQRKKVSRGKKNELKFYRFSPCAFYTLRKKFPDKKFNENFNAWTEADRKFSEFDPALCDGTPIYDVNSILYLISTLDIRDVGYEKEVLSFSRGELFKVKIHARKKTTIYSEFTVNSPNGKEEFEDDLDVLEVRLIPQAVNEKDRDSFKFLGLRGNIKIYVDPERRLVVRLRGKVKVLGSIDINLKKADLVP